MKTMTSFAEKVLSAPLGRTYLFSVGQAGYIIKSAAGKLLGIDLYLSDCVERLEGHAGFKRLLPKILAPGELCFDLLIATHPHWDHFDADAMPELMDGGKTELFASVECRKLVQERGMDESRVRYVRPGDSIERDGFAVRFINCDHGESAGDAVAVLVSVDGKTVLEAGDTCLRTDRRDEYLSAGAIDVLIAPINGAYGNMDENDCAVLSGLLSPALTVPCHYGMFASHGGNVGKFYDIMTKQYPDRQLLLMAQGEEYTIG